MTRFHHMLGLVPNGQFAAAEVPGGKALVLEKMTDEEVAVATAPSYYYIEISDEFLEDLNSHQSADDLKQEIMRWQLSHCQGSE